MEKETKKITIDSNSEEVRVAQVSLLPYLGRIMAIASLTSGCIALLFSLAPFAIGWFAAIFWLLYPFSLISLLTAIPAFVSKRVWKPTLGIIFSMLSIIIATFSSSYYVLAMAGSVNGLTHIAKSFVDALVWPF